MTQPDTTMSQAAAKGPRASTALLKLQADERLVAHVRRGNQAAFEVLVSRYRARLLAFCRHMLGASAGRDAEDVLQEVFTSAYRAMLGDTRPINVRPWLYRIARNRCLNHLRRDPMQSVEGMELTVVDERIGTAETVHQRAEVRQLLSDIQALPESQRTAILLREIDDLSYEQIAMAMDTTVAAVKSLLVRARVGLAEAAEARRLSCDEVRFELGQQAEGLIQKLSPPSRRHVKECKSCSGFAQDLKDTNRTLAALAPAAGLILLVKGVLGSIGGASHAGSAGAGGAAAGAGGAALGGGTITSIGGMISAKAATGLAAAVAVTGAAVEVRHVTTPPRQKTESAVSRVAAAPVATNAPVRTTSGGAPLPVGSTPVAASAARDAEPTTPDDADATTPTTPDEVKATTASAGDPTPVTVPITTPGATTTTTPTIDEREDSVDLPTVQDRTDTATVHPPVRLPVPMPSKTPAPSSPSTPAPTPAPAPETTPAPAPESTPAPEPTPGPAETTPPTTGG
ncbi:MAG: sigma-70 family RNA polymerase sigma factor [Patulibacter minatonensis]